MFEPKGKPLTRQLKLLNGRTGNQLAAEPTKRSRQERNANQCKGTHTCENSIGGLFDSALARASKEPTRDPGAEPSAQTL